MSDIIQGFPNKPVEPLKYEIGGLDNIYLLDGYLVDTFEDEETIAISDLPGLRREIAIYIVNERKIISPKEARFLREVLNLTQKELGIILQVSDQTVARWEKGSHVIDASVDMLFRMTVITEILSEDDETQVTWKDKIKRMRANVQEKDDTIMIAGWFSHGSSKWKGEPRVAVGNGTTG